MPGKKKSLIPNRSYNTLVIRGNSDSGNKIITITTLSLKHLKIPKLNKYVNSVLPM